MSRQIRTSQSFAAFVPMRIGSNPYVSTLVHEYMVKHVLHPIHAVQLYLVSRKHSASGGVERSKRPHSATACKNHTTHEWCALCLMVPLDAFGWRNDVVRGAFECVCLCINYFLSIILCVCVWVRVFGCIIPCEIQ